ncbi:MAG: hypothetical protein EBR54_00265 [Flavobacteriia bacterium]|nr:hypothetical protein [Flavobacteriia bacterium]
MARVKTCTVPPASVTCTCAEPLGGVALVPVAKLTHCAGALQETTGVKPFKHCPKNQVYPQF